MEVSSSLREFSPDTGEVSGDHGVLQYANRARDSRTDMTNNSTAIARQ